MKFQLAAIAAALALFACSATAQPLRIGVLTDRNGMVSDVSGDGSAVAARLAVEDFGPTVLNRPIAVLVGDHQNKPDIGASIAREWFDQNGVQMIVDLPNSSVALAVERIAN